MVGKRSKISQNGQNSCLQRAVAAGFFASQKTPIPRESYKASHFENAYRSRASRLKKG